MTETHEQSGFTLVELLVAIAVLGLLMALLFGGLRFGTRAWEHSNIAVSDTDQVRLAQSLFRREIEQACPRRIGHGNQASIAFAGQPASVSFFAPPPLGLGVPGCAAVAFQVRPANRGADVFFEVQPGAQLREHLLLRSVAAAEFGYLGRDAKDGPAIWRSNWVGQRDLPLLVRLTVTFKPGDTRVWPELFVAPRISGEADCTYDQATKSCGTN